MKKALAEAIEQRGYTTLTPVQEAVTAPELEGADLLVSAQTGSGKTLGFGLAIAPTLLQDAETFSAAGLPLALVIAPTRELAIQVKRELAWLYAKAGAVLASCVGGMDMRDERRQLGRGAHIVVATPGRLRDHITRNSIDLSQLRAVVLDEADEMLDLGFREDLEFILSKSPEDRQTLMFSATVPNSIAKLAKSYQRDAIRVSTKSESKQHTDINYRAMNVSARDGENAIINVLRYYEAPNALVFCNTRSMVNRMTTRLSNRGFSVVALSGELSQNERTHALQSMRDGRARICVATDVAARGIDLPNLDLVVHAELPSNHETLLHRSGRTGRAGRKGVSVLIVPPKSRRKAERILHMAKVKAEWTAAPSAEIVKVQDEERMLADPAWLEEISGAQLDAAKKLADRFTPEQIAAAYLRMYHDRHTAPEELSDAIGEAPKPREAFDASIWFSIAGGREKDAEPRRILPMLCKAGDLTKDDIGAIRVQQDITLVEIREARVAGFLAAVGPAMTLEAGAKLIKLDTPPADTRSARPPFQHKSNDRPPAREKNDRPPARDKPVRRETTKPIDWNDEPAPRAKKPKPAAWKAKPKSSGKPDAPRAAPEENPAVTRIKPDAPKPKRVDTLRSSKGPPPPQGKKNSKKNKARTKAGKLGGKPLGGGSGFAKRKPS